MRTWLINAGLLATGLLLFVLSEGPQPIAWTAIPSLFLLLCYLDRLPARMGLGLLLPLFLAAYCLAWFGVAPGAPPVIYAAIVLVYGVPYFIPFFAHRVFAAESPSWLRFLVFPSAWVSVEYANQALSPYGSWLSLAYGQDAGGTVSQLASLGGVPLVSFFLTASAAALAFVVRLELPPARKLASVLGLIVAACAALAWPVYSVRAYRPQQSVTVAGVLADHALQDAANTAMVDARQPLSPASQRTIRAATDALNRTLLRQTVQAAAAGARIVAWPEASGMVRDADEPAFLSEAGTTARELRVYLFAAYVVWRPGQPRPIENKVAAIDPSGRVVWTFRKAHPIVAFEDSRVVRGDRALGVIDTPYGRVGLAICHDLDFPEQIRRALNGVDLLVDPSNDWPEIERLHADMHRYRAIEYGVPVFRPADHGASVIADRLGRAHLWQSSGERGGSFIALTPIGSIPTAYSILGGWLAWVAGLILTLATGLKVVRLIVAR